MTTTGAGDGSYSFVDDIKFRLRLGQNPVEALFGALRTLVSMLGGGTLRGPF